MALKSFADFMREIDYFRNLREQVESLIQEEKRRKMIREGLDVIAQQFKDVLSPVKVGEQEVNTLAQQATTLLSLYPLLLQSAQTPEQVGQVLSTATVNALELQQKLGAIRQGVEVLNEMNKLLENITETVKQAKGATNLPQNIKSIYEAMESYILDTLHGLRSVAKSLVLSGQPEKASELFVQSQAIGREVLGTIKELAMKEEEKEFAEKMLEREMEGRKKLIQEEWKHRKEVEMLKLKDAFEFELKKFEEQKLNVFGKIIEEIGARIDLDRQTIRDLVNRDKIMVLTKDEMNKTDVVKIYDRKTWGIRNAMPLKTIKIEDKTLAEHLKDLFREYRNMLYSFPEITEKISGGFIINIEGTTSPRRNQNQENK